MDGIKSEIKNLLNKACISGEVVLSLPPKVEMGDLAFACFDIAKAWNMTPVDAAKKIVDIIARSEATKQSRF